MAERLRQLPKQILEIWNKYTRKQKSIFISVVAIVVIALAILVLIVNRPNLKVVTTCANYEELSQVTEALTAAGYQYTVEDGSLTVQVESNILTQAKMALATADIKSIGYTFEDAMNSSFSTTESDRQKQYQHYLETKLGTDLEAISGVKAASVTVTLGEATNTFYATTADASVGVVLSLSSSITEDTANSMALFLRMAVGNKDTSNITIISSDGETLFSGADSSTTTGVGYNSQQKYKAQIETTVKTSLKQSLLATGLFDDAYIVPNYVMDWNAVNTIATEYSAPDGMDQGLYSESYVEKSSGGTGSGGTPGTTSNDSDTTYNVTDGSSSTSTYSVEKYAYLPNELVTTTTVQPGSIIYDSSSLTVTFIKNIIYNEDEAEDLGYLEGGITWEQFKANNVNSVAVDVDPTWLTAIASGTGIAEGNITVLAYNRPYFVDSESGNVTRTVTFWLQIVLAAAILGLLAFVVIRSARPLTVEEKEPELSVEEMLATTKENQPAVDEIDINDKSETRKAIEKFVDENPEAVALLLRNWLNDDWQ